MRAIGKVAILVLASLALWSGQVASAAQQDRPGSKDHPLFNRLPDFRKVTYSDKEFDQYDKFKDGKGKQVSVEGRRYAIEYYIERGKKAPSEIQVLRNFTNAVTKIGGPGTR